MPYQKILVTCLDGLGIRGVPVEFVSSNNVQEVLTGVNEATGSELATSPKFMTFLISKPLSNQHNVRAR